MIPLCDLQLQYQALKPEIDTAIEGVCTSSHFILGPNVKAFEKEIETYCGSGHAVGVNSGTDALQLALRGLGIGPGDEVITTPFTFIATSEAICMVGATPVFVDIDLQTFNIDPKQIPLAITDRTRAIIPVHIFGHPCEMHEIMQIAEKHDLRVVEDCAQALGATYQGQKLGTIGDVGCLSFFPSKNLGCFGDGGMVVSKETSVAERIEMLRRHGGKIKYYHSELGLNSRLDELQAAILRIKLKYLDHWNNERRFRAGYYQNHMCELKGVTMQAWDDRSNSTSVYHQFTVLVENRDHVQKELSAAGISTAVYYPVPLHLQEVHQDLGYTTGDFPRAEIVSNRCLSLPMFPELTDEQQDIVIRALTTATSEKQQRKSA